MRSVFARLIDAHRLALAERDQPPSAKSNPVEVVGASQNVWRGAGHVPMLTREARSLTYELIYRRQPWVYVMVNKLARAVARLPLKAFQRDTDGARERIREHAIVELLARPWPRGSAYALKQFLVWSLYVHGNALLAKARASRASAPGELWPVPWRAVEVAIGASGQPERYRFHGMRGVIELEPRDVVHIALDPIDGIGVSPLEPLRITLQLEDAAALFAAHHFENRATPSGAFSTDAKLDKATVPRLRAELEGLYAGVENAGRFGLFDQGLKWQPMGQTAVDLALIDQRKLSREEVAAVFDVPQPMVGILDRATFSNITEQHKMLYQDTLGPPLALLEETLGAQLLDGEPAFAGVFVEFDLAEMLKADLPARAQAYAQMIGWGVMSPDEARDRENLPRAGGASAELWMPLNLVPADAEREDVAARASSAAGHKPLEPPVVSEPSRNGRRDTPPILAES